MSLQYRVKLEMLIAHVLPLSCCRRNSRIYPHCNCGLYIRQIWIQLITACGKCRKRRCTKKKHWSGAINDATDEWLPQWRHNPAWPTPFSVAVSVRPD